MKNRFVIFSLLLLVTILSVTSCAMTEHTVTFVLGDGRKDVVTTVTMNSGLYEPESIREGYYFGGWFTDEELTVPYISKNIVDDLTLYARWVSKGEKSVTFVFDNGQPSVTYFYDDYLTPPKDPEREGYIFGGWINASDSSLFDFSMPSESNLVLKAKWNEVPAGVKVIFDPCNGDDAATYSTTYGGLIETPPIPERTGYTFSGWYADKYYNAPFDFSTKITESVTVYAKWTLGGIAFGNGIATDLIKSTLYIENYRYNVGFVGQVTSSNTSRGSGVIILEKDGFYYCLTNDHVIKTDPEYARERYTVYDCYGNEYEAALVNSDPGCDLALLRFAKVRELKVAELAVSNAHSGTLIASVGNPGGMINNVSYGYISKYDASLPDSDGSVDMDFAVGWHNAPVDHGSSGGAVFGADMKLVGINFAAGSNTDGEFVCGFFIPIEIVREFLKSIGGILEDTSNL